MASPTSTEIQPADGEHMSQTDNRLVEGRTSVPRSNAVHSTSADRIINFFDPVVRAPFDSRRPQSTTLEAILTAYSDDQLEHMHDYIQYLFPLPERSPVEPNAPRITPEVRQEFKARSELRKGLTQAFIRMLDFYGYGLNTTVPKPVESGVTASTTDKLHPDGSGHDVTLELFKLDSFEGKARNTWLTRVDHNHRRITRIIRCMRILGVVKEAQLFAATLLEDDINDIISHTSKGYWTDAAGLGLESPPSYPHDPIVPWLAATNRDEQKADGTFDPSAEYEEGTPMYILQQHAKWATEPNSEG